MSMTATLKNGEQAIKPTGRSFNTRIKQPVEEGSHFNMDAVHLHFLYACASSLETGV